MSIPAPVIEALYPRLGGAEALPYAIRSEADLARLTIEGLPLPALQAIRRAGFSARELAAIIPPRTLRHRIGKGEPLSTVETERAIRLVSLQIQAEFALEGKEKARIWLRRPLPLLDGMTPLAAAQTEHGAEAVRQILGSLSRGVAAWGRSAPGRPIRTPARERSRRLGDVCRTRRSSCGQGASAQARP
jgi:putative toxin-antitoxin system antitoxin component (TIGR02293 family)